MLTGKMVRVRFARDRVIPAYLPVQDDQWLDVAAQLLDLFRTSQQQTRGEIEADIDEMFSGLTQPLIHQGLAKLVEDRCDFEAAPGHPPDELREAVFRAATSQREKLRDQQGADFDREAAITEAAAQLQLPTADVEAGLFGDLKSEQRLVQFKDITPQRLLERYNVSLVQAILLRSTGVEVRVQNESPQRWRQMFRAIKFHRLICDVEPLRRNGYLLKLDGPLSLFSATQKYGMQLAVFLPTLLLCEKFELTADVRWGVDRRPKKLAISDEDGLVSHTAESGRFVPPEVPMFVEQFRRKFDGEWELRDEPEIVDLGKSYWVPDYCLVHVKTGKTVLLDVLGFWRKSSVERHLALLNASADRPFLVALSDQMHVDEAEAGEMPAHVVRFRHMPLADEIAKRAHALLFGKR